MKTISRRALRGLAARENWRGKLDQMNLKRLAVARLAQRSALQQRAVDAQENPLPTIKFKKSYRGNPTSTSPAKSAIRWLSSSPTAR
jgi:hypothetical protein